MKKIILNSLDHNFYAKSTDYSEKRQYLKIKNGRAYSVIRYEREMKEGRLLKFLKATAFTVATLGIGLLREWPRAFFEESI